MGHGHAVAVAVDHRHMSRVLRRMPRIETWHVALDARLDLRRHRRGIFLRRQLADGNIEEARIAEETILVGGRALHRFADHAQIFDAVVPECGEIEILKHVEHLDQHDAAARRVVGRYLIAAILTAQRLAPLRLIVCKVFGSDEATVGLHVGGDAFRQLAAIENVRTALGDHAQRLRVVRIVDDIADALVGAVFAAIELPAGRRERETIDSRGAIHHAGIGPEQFDVRTHHPAAFGPNNRRRNDVAPWQHTEPRMRLIIRLQRRWHADRLITEVIHLAAQDEAITVARFTLDQVFPHIRARSSRRGCVEIEILVEALAWEIDAGAAETRDAGHQRIDDALHQRAGNRGVDGVAARLQHVRAGLRRFGLRRDNHRLPFRHAFSREMSCDDAARPRKGGPPDLTRFDRSHSCLSNTNRATIDAFKAIMESRRAALANDPSPAPCQNSVLPCRR